MFIIYDLIFILFAAVYAPVLFLRKKWHGGFRQRFGLFSAQELAKWDDRPRIWIHAVSVGEVQVTAGLVSRLRTAYPQHELVMTVVTPTGYQLARQRFGDEVRLLFAPVDLSFVVRKFLRIIRPQIYITAETELWPNMFYALLHLRIPIVLVNGRISERAFGWYRLAKLFFLPLLRRVSAFCVQTAVEARKFIILGARPTSVFVTGNFKFDEISGLVQDVGAGLPVEKGQLVWIAGSTHPGEEEIVLETFRQLRQEFPSLCLVIAPRHIERVRDLEKLINRSGFSTLCLSSGPQALHPETVILVDTIGQLRYLYRYADVVFVGKTLVGYGGQNILEPAFFSRAIIVGPHMENFQNICDIFSGGGGILRIKDQDELLSEMQRLLRDPLQRQTLGETAYRLLARQQGATDKAFAIISQFLLQ